MATVDAFDAKFNFSALLERAERGEQILITRRGKSVARLMPIATAREGKVSRVASADHAGGRCLHCADLVKGAVV
jgi:prevent-host-death family protein